MRYLILGATGTLGKATIRELLKRDPDASILCVSRDELKQAEMKAEINDERLSFGLGDIRDKQSIRHYFDNQDVVFHFAALKRIPEMEANPLESLKTNVLGTINAVESAHEARVPHFIFSSTDKACRPVNTYGACKFLSEQIVFDRAKKSNTRFSVYRWGNVVFSRGAALHGFKEAIERGERVNLTHPESTRFWIRIEDAVKFMLETYREHSLLPKVPNMRSAKITEVARAIGELVGKPDVKFFGIGLRPGEKIHEDIVFNFPTGYTQNSYNSERLTFEELKDLIKESVA